MVSIKGLFSSSSTRKAAGPDTPFARRFRNVSSALGWALLAGCLVEAVLWILSKNSPAAESVFDWFPHQPLAAFACFSLIGVGVLSVQKIPYTTRLFQFAAGVLIILIEFFSVTLGAGGVWGMDRLTAWVVLLLGFILASGGSRIPLIGYIRQMAIFAVFFLCALVLAGYIYEGEDATGGLVAFLHIPWTSGLMGLVAGHALLLQHPNFGVMRVLSGEGFGSAVMRRLLPTTIVLLLLLGWMLAIGEEMHLYPASFGESMYAVLAISGFSGMLVTTAIYLNRLDGDRVSQEAALRRNQQQLQSILDNTTSIICMKDLEGRYLLVNKSFCRAVGRTKGECVGKHVRELFSPEITEGTLERNRRALERGEAIEAIESISSSPETPARTFLCATFPLLDATGFPYAVCDVYTDITDIKRQEEEIQHLNQSLREKTRRQEAANNELEAFSYSVSHDLRAPLRHISGFGQLLSQRNKDILDDKSRHYLSVILQSVDRMGALIDDLLAFSRASKVDLSWKRVSMQETVEDVRTELESHWAGPRVAWDIGHLPEVEGDPAMLRLVWVNLLSNAMKYSGKNPVPRISVQCVPNGTEEDVFSIVDNGAGFDMRYVDKLFGVFQRLHSSQEYEGTGIGLAMIRRILERHGGRIWAESSVGQGASFYFVLPTTKSAADKALEA
ncbi:MAG: aphA [Fibrobacteria bacterium]|jgi:PAS domain S-box-containing protein|nr:aphA [Fibrobacteria bacterium]